MRYRVVNLSHPDPRLVIGALALVGFGVGWLLVAGLRRVISDMRST